MTNQFAGEFSTSFLTTTYTDQENDTTQTPVLNTSSSSPSVDINHSGRERFIGLEIWTGIIIAVTLWILLSLVIYGVKTKRWWRSPGKSSLNNGIVYTSCVIAIASTLPKLAITEVLHQTAHTNMTYVVSCELIGDLRSTSYFLSLYAMYVFLWVLQRRIYTHPYVKEHISRPLDYCSRVFIVLLTLAFTVVIILYIIRTEYEDTGHGCQIHKHKNTGIGTIAIALAGVTVQIMMLALSIYPAVKARLPNPDDSVQPQNNQRCMSFCGNFCGVTEGASPIHLTVRRAALNTIIIVISYALAAFLATLARPDSSPLVVEEALYDTSSMINVFCMVATFGFAGQILTLFCTTCPKRRVVISTQM